jgi:hypothetical protein
MVWQVSTDSNDYRIQNNKNNSYREPFIDYFTVQENGNIGINNGNPDYILDVKGNTYIDGIIYTSNIMGIEHNYTSNILKINYEDVETNSNLLNVYGTSTFYGKIGIGVTKPENELDIIGKIKCDEIEGIGSNITLISTGNISDGILPVIRGGIGIGNIEKNQLIYGGTDKIEQNNSLSWNSTASTLNATKFKGNGNEITSLDANKITTGILNVGRGGTGRSKFDIGGGIIVGNLLGDNRYDISQTDALIWNNSESELKIEGNIKLPAGSNILIDGVPLYDFASIPIASSYEKGMIKISEGDFSINEDDQLILAKDGSSKWQKEDEKIWYPSGTANSNHCVGIGKIPAVGYRLDVNGDINTSNGVFKINGINIIEENSNIISDRINTFTLDHIAKPLPIDTGQETQNGGWENKFFSIRNTADINKEFFISSAPYSYQFTFDQSVLINNDLNVKGSLILEKDDTQSILIVNQLYSDTSTNNGSIVNFKKSDETHFRINKEGNLGLGRDSSQSFDEISGNEPAEKLHVIGNIIATGYIKSYYSDKRLKEFISNIENPLSIINKLNGYFYKANKLAIENGFTDERNIGLSAQDVQKVLPELVKLAPFDTVKNKNGESISKSGNNYLTVCYEKFAPVFVEAIKELNNQVRELKSENELLKKENKKIKEDIIKIKAALSIN